MIKSFKAGLVLGILGFMLFSCTALKEMQAVKTVTWGPEWSGPAMSYSGYRAGQSPELGLFPTHAEILEDLQILSRHWNLIRLYGSDQHSADVLAVIREHNIPIKVMLGAWLAGEPGEEDLNVAQIKEMIRLTRAYPDIVVAVNVGNEILVDWSFHAVPEEKVIEYVRWVKTAVDVPVTVADNYVYWRDHGSKLAAELDFITIHTYPIWERRDIHEGLSYTIENFEGVRKALPDKKIVIGEAGWATYTEGNLHVPRAGDEQKQLRYFQELSQWSQEKGVTVFWFEAFDEAWKGTGTEGHWGLFSEYRKAKPAVIDWYPDLKPDVPTSPEYAEEADLPLGPPVECAFHPTWHKRVIEGTINPLGPWNGVVTAAELVQGSENESALVITHDGSDWGGVYVNLPTGLDVSAASTLHLKVRIPRDVVDLELKLEGPTGSGSVNLCDFIQGSPGDWTEYRVPLTAFPQVDLEQLTFIGFWNPRDKNGQYMKSEILVAGLRFD